MYLSPFPVHSRAEWQLATADIATAAGVAYSVGYATGALNSFASMFGWAGFGFNVAFNTTIAAAFIPQIAEGFVQLPNMRAVDRYRFLGSVGAGIVAGGAGYQGGFRNASWVISASRAQRSSWDGLPVRPNGYGASEPGAGLYVDRRIALSKNVPDGIYKFVVDMNEKVWLAPVSESVPHSALVPRGETVRGAGYVAIKNGKANVNARSGHYMRDNPVLSNSAAAYDLAIRKTFRLHSIKVIDNNVGQGSGPIHFPRS